MLFTPWLWKYVIGATVRAGNAASKK